MHNITVHEMYGFKETRVLINVLIFYCTYTSHTYLQNATLNREDNLSKLRKELSACIHS